MNAPITTQKYSFDLIILVSKYKNVYFTKMFSIAAIYVKSINYARLFMLLMTSYMLQSCSGSDSKDVTINRSFYYWKSVFKLSDFEKQRVDSLHINTIYLKFFDVDWNENTHSPAPVAQVRIAQNEYLQQKNIIPTVFITNQCIYKIDASQTDSTANNILRLVKNIMSVNGLVNVKEIQLDCDWTENTKEKYFALLRTLVKTDTSILFSATIRLHQIKFSGKTGVPPVKKGLLMCYNMGNLKDPKTTNSILDSDELQKYIGTLSGYPLPLDVGLPIFEWSVLTRQNNFIGLMQNLPPGFYNKNIFTKKDNFYTVLNDTILNGYSLKKNDVIRNEQSDYKEIMKTIALLKNKLSSKTEHINVSLYHLDSLTLSKYSLHEIENIYDRLR